MSQLSRNSGTVNLGVEELQLREQVRKSSLLDTDILTLLRSQSSDLSVTALAATFWHTTETYFAGQISTQSLAAYVLGLSICGTISIPSHAIILISRGLIANALGTGDNVKGGRVACQGIVASVVAALLTCPLLFFFGGDIVRLLGATGETQELTTLYLKLIAFSAIPQALAYQLEGILNACGYTERTRNCAVFSVTANFLLCQWFIFGGLGLPAFGFIGLPIATFVSSMLSLFLNAFFISRSCPLKLFDVKGYAPEKRIIFEIVWNALPVAFGSGGCMIGQLAIARALTSCGPDALAAFGIANILRTVLLVPPAGLGTASYCIVAQNYSAGLFQRTLQCWKSAMGLCLLYLIPGILFSLTLADIGASIFAKEGQVITLAAAGLAVLILGEIPGLMHNVSSNVLLGMKRPVVSGAIEIVQQALLPLLLLPVAVTKLGPIGVCWVIAFSQVISAFIAGGVVRWELRRAAIVKLG